MTSACSAALRPAQSRPPGTGTWPEASLSRSSVTGRAAPLPRPSRRGASGSNQELKTCRKIHWVQRT